MLASDGDAPRPAREDHELKNDGEAAPRRRRDGGPAELRDPEDVHDREDGLERHLEDHRDREEDDRAAVPLR